jgi:hypothetical protein
MSMETTLPAPDPCFCGWRSSFDDESTLEGAWIIVFDGGRPYNQGLEVRLERCNVRTGASK